MHMHSSHDHDTPAEHIPEDRRSVCIVTGDMFDTAVAEERGHFSVYQGKKKYFCCATCVKLFEENPEQYLQKTNGATKSLILKEKEHLVDNIWAFRFTPPEPFTWIPGQFMFVELPHENPDTEGTKRFFTVSSAPFEKIVQITTRVTKSTFKQALSHLTVGGELRLLAAPHGEFIWEEDNKPLVFVAGGIGITPFRSMLKQRAYDGLPLNVTLIYGNRTDAIPFKEEIDAWVAADTTLKVHYITGVPLTGDILSDLIPNLDEALIYLSGAEPMVEALSEQLEGTGLPKAQIKHDTFPHYTEKNY